ncbi:hypothetical protein B795N_01630 [Marinilactibacillus psychrotolerans]|uniref:GW dipeptide domain-containing protein n=1 Tax=Marinilactibacillus psychrotolerans TaxID=191770 RepID=UPI001DD1C503|nr:GW dipeptide domain-containing protein [Marinilactibacillus psychrotolerans]GEQ32281.1 hypothetical protein B795N_01630 [Marinilactibacillus psychrotolerans]
MKKNYFQKKNIITCTAILLFPATLLITSSKVEAQTSNVQVMESENNEILERLEAYILNSDVTKGQIENLPSSSIENVFEVNGGLDGKNWSFEVKSKESGIIFISDSLGNIVEYPINKNEPQKYAFEHSVDNKSYSFYFVSETSMIIDHLVFKIGIAIDESNKFVNGSEETPSMDEQNSVSEPIEEDIVSKELKDESNDTKDNDNEITISDPSSDEKAIISNEIEPHVRTSSVIQNATRYYIVSSGDTLWNVANKFGISVQNLQSWNNLSSNTITAGNVLSLNGINIYQKIDEEKMTFLKKSEFIQYMSGRAKNIAHEKGKEQLYASVMIAQASLESNFGTSTLAINGNNLFGMKGSYNGYSIVKKTWEFINGVNTYVDADFKFYPNFSNSLNDNASRLRNGTNWDPNYYSGTWVRKTSSYKDATKWLTGRYATDPNYNQKLNGIIETYNLLQYDLDTVDVNYETEILQRSFSIDSLPWGSAGSERVASSTDYYNKKVQVIRENKSRTYALIQVDGKEIGWVDKRAFELVLSKAVDYEVVITNTNYSIDSLPWGTKGYKKLYSASDFNASSIFQVTEETTNGAYVRLSQNGVVKGWIDKKAISSFNSVKVSYKAKVNYAGHSINSLPWGINGFVNVGKSDDYLGKEFTISREAKGGNYLLLSDGSKIVGWVDKRAIESFETNSVSYSDTISHAGYSIDSRPWGYKGYEQIDSTNNYTGKVIEVIRETTNGSYAFIAYNGKELGWIDKRAFDRKQVNYQTFISTPGYSFDSLPWGEKGFTSIGNSDNYINQKVTIIAESKNGAYGLALLNGKSLGWIDKRAIENFETNIITYKETVTKINYSVDSKPWGYSGFENVSSSSVLIGKDVHILRETENGAYAYISMDGAPIGWVDKRAFGRIPATPNQYAVIKSGYSIDSLPWGEKGYSKLYDSSIFSGKTVKIIQKSNNLAYAHIILDNKELGWIDLRALNMK